MKSCTNADQNVSTVSTRRVLNTGSFFYIFFRAYYQTIIRKFRPSIIGHRTLCRVCVLISTKKKNCFLLLQFDKHAYRNGRNENVSETKNENGCQRSSVRAGDPPQQNVPDGRLNVARLRRVQRIYGRRCVHEYRNVRRFGYPCSVLTTTL